MSLLTICISYLKKCLCRSSLSFELGFFEPDYWTNDPMHPWHIVTSTSAPDGSYCAKSDTIHHDETSQLALNFTSTESGKIHFFSRVSSEAGYDFLYFYIDGVEQEHWSGEHWWAEHSYTIPPGRHIYIWAYTKDHSVDGGSDCAWIDYITLPPLLDGTAEQAEMPLTLHPNPTTDQVTVSLEHEGDFSISVYNTNGKLIFTECNTSIVSFKGLPSGLYHIVMEQNGQRWSGRIIKM